MAVNGTAHQRTAPLEEIGVTGVVRSAGQVDDEQLPELRGRNKINVIKQMTQNDPVIGALCFAFKMLIRQMKFRIDPAFQENAALEAAEFIDGAMFKDMSMSWKDTISDIVSFLWWGWEFSEIVYKIRDGDSRDPTHRSRYNDGRIGWRKWPIRSQDTLWEWQFDDNGGVQAMVQSAPPDYQTRTIPIEKALLFRTESNRGNPEGLSILRTAFRPWRYKSRIENIEAIGVERDLVGYPVVWLPPSYMAADATAPQQALYTYAKKMVTAMRRDEWEGAVMALQYDERGNKLFDVSLLSTGGTRQFDTGSIISRYDQRILMSVMADFMMLGSGQTGSWALSADKTDLFSVALGAWVDGICDVINTHGIPRLTLLNGMPQEINPVLAHENITSKDVKEFSDSVAKLLTAGGLTPDTGLENAIRETMELPPLEEGGGSADGDSFLGSDPFAFYNPYHDAKGRFTSGGTSHTTVHKDGKREKGPAHPDNVQKAGPKPAAKSTAKSPKPKSSGSGPKMSDVDSLAKRAKLSEHAERQRNSEADRTEKSMTAAQQRAVRSYAGSGYEKINGDLRQGKEPGKVARDLDAAIAHNKVGSDTVVYRGVGPSLGNQLKPGFTFQDKGFVSTSTHERSGYAFAQGSSPIMVIKVPKGHPALPVRSKTFGEEREYVLPRGTKFKVEDIKHGVQIDTGAKNFNGRPIYSKQSIVTVSIVS